MDTILEFYQQNKTWIEPLTFILIFAGVARIAFNGKGSLALITGLCLLLTFSFLRWSHEHDWHFQDWGVFGFIIVTLAIVVCGVNFILRSRTQ